MTLRRGTEREAGGGARMSPRSARGEDASPDEAGPGAGVISVGEFTRRVKTLLEEGVPAGCTAVREASRPAESKPKSVVTSVWEDATPPV